MISKGITENRERGKRTLAILLVVVMVAMVATPLASAGQTEIPSETQSPVIEGPESAPQGPVPTSPELPSLPLEEMPPEDPIIEKGDPVESPETQPLTGTNAVYGEPAQTPPEEQDGQDVPSTTPIHSDPVINPHSPEQSGGFVPDDFSAELAFPSTVSSSIVPEPIAYSPPIYPTPLAVLWDNGPLVNGPGLGAGGADASILQTALGMSTYGFGAQYTIPNRMADDFVVGSAWSIDSFTFFSYQTGSTTVSTFDGVYMQIWDAAPNGGGAVIWGDMVTNRISSTAWSNIYRVLDTNTLDTNRPIMEVVAATPGLALPVGTYWVDFAFTGTLASGPWMPPISINTQTTTGNALQWTQGSGMWNQALDGGTGTQQGAPFLIEGPDASVELMPDYQSKYCSFNGEQIYYPLTLTNLGPTPGTYDLYATGNSWPVDFIYGSDPSMQMLNPSFETGDFTSWNTVDLADPYVGLQVDGAGNTCPDMSDGFDTAPTDGIWSLQTGFNGAGPGHILVGQDYPVYPSGETYLVFDYRASWDLQMIPASIDRTFSVLIEPAGGGPPLQTNLILTAVANTYMSDTGIRQGVVDLTPFAGSTVYIEFDWWIPEDYSGPAYFELDNMRMITTYGSIPLVSEQFEGAFPPAGWTRIDYRGMGVVWLSNAATGSPNYAGGSGNCADANNQPNPTDTGLRTPSFNLNGVISPTLEFDMSYYDLTPGSATFAYAEVRVSIDGGTSWTPIAFYDEDHSPTGPGEHIILDLSSFVGNPNVMVEFHFDNTVAPIYWWQIDNVEISVLGPVSSIDVPAGGSASFIARVTVPGGAVPGDFDIADITASSHMYLSEQFEPPAWPPVGWTVVDNEGNGVVWLWNNAWGDGNYVTGGTDFCACCDSDTAGIVEYDTELWTPSFDLSTATSPMLSYDANYQNLIPGWDFLDVGISTDSGSSWTNLLSWSENHGGFYSTPSEHVDIDLSAYIGQPDVIIRWHYYNPNAGDWDWYAEIDNVIIYDAPFTISNTAQIETIWPYSTPWTDDMESGPGDWTTWDNGGGTVWELGNPAGGPGPANAFSPTDCWGTNLLDYYYTESDAILTSPLISLGAANQVLSFAQWYEIDGNYFTGDEEDGGWVEISNDMEATWTQIFPVGGYNDWTGDTPSGYSTEVECFAGATGTWIPAEFDLSAYANQVIQFRFRFWSEPWNEYNDYAGWYIDNVFVGERTYGVELTPDYQSTTDYWVDVDYTFTVTNTGSLADNYDLSAIGNTWPVTFWNSFGTTHIIQTGNIPPGGSMDFIARMTIPWGTPTGSSDWAAIVATSQSDPGFTFDVAYIETTALDPYDVDVSPPAQSATGYVGGYCDHFLTIDNTGVWSDTYNLAVAGNVWPITFWQIMNTQTLMSEQFEGAFPPAGWTTINYGGTGVWTRNDQVPDLRLNYAGTGFCADADSDSPYTLDWMNTGLRTPSFSLVGYTMAQLDFDTSFYIYSTPQEFANVRVSINGGSTWSVIAHYKTSMSPNGPGTHITLDLSPFIGNPAVIVEFFYGNAWYDWWWEVDNVEITAINAIGPISSIGPIPAGDSVDFIARVAIPALAPPGSSDLGTITVTSQNDPVFTWDTATVQTFCASPYNVLLSPDTQTKTDLTGNSVDFILTIDNTGVWSDSYALTVSGNAWPTTLLDITGTTQIFSTGIMAVGDTMNFIARVSIPIGLPPGVSDTATIRATSVSYFYVWDQVQVHTHGEPSYWFQANPPIQTRFGWTGEYVDHIISVTNLGQSRDVYLPMFGDFQWPITFWNLDYYGNKNEQTWWIGPCDPGQTIQFIAEVRVPRVNFGDFDQVTITITSEGNRAVQRTVQIRTTTSLQTPYFNNFESGIFGQGITDVDWTTDDPNRCGLNHMTSNSGTHSMYLSEGQTSITSCPFYLRGLPTAIVSCWIQRGANPPEAGEDLFIEYKNPAGYWIELGYYPGDGPAGETFFPVFVLPHAALHSSFQLRFRETDTDGIEVDQDYWHIDDVYIGPPDPDIDLLPNTVNNGGGQGSLVQTTFTINNNALHPDSFSVDVTGNTWPTYVCLPVLEDDFNDGNINGWIVVDEGTTSAPSNWFNDAGVRLGQNHNIYSYNGQALSGTYVVNGYFSAQDYILQADMRSTDNDGIGLMGRYTNPQNYYRFHWSLDTGWDKDLSKLGLQRRVLDKCVDGVWTVLESDNTPYVSGQWYNVEMKFIGDRIQVYIDNILIFDVTDSSLAGGGIALYSWGNTNSYFDDVMVLSTATNQIGPIWPGDNAEFIVVVEIPAGTAVGVQDTADIIVTSILDPTVSDTSQLITKVYSVHNLDKNTWHETIQDAVDLADPGNHIWAYPFVYEETVTVDKPLTIHGVDQATTIVDGGGGGGGGILDNILIYADDAFHTAPNTYVDQALNSLGLPYTAHYDGDFAGFETDLTTNGPWDLVIWGGENYYPPDSARNAMNTYLTSGGRLICCDWAIDDNPGHPLWTAMGFTWVSSYGSTIPVYWWEPGHQLFNNPESVPEFTSVFDPGYGTNGHRVEPLPGFDAIAGYTTPGPDPNEAALIYGNDGRTIYKSWLDGGNDADLDSDGQPDAVELWTNMISSMGGGGAVFEVTSSNVNIDGFTLQNADLGIFLDNVNNCMIDSNSILNCKNGIKSVDSGMNTISGNEIIGLGAQSTVGTIVINEICTNADWIELYNYGPAQDMSGWTLYADEFPIQGGISYTFPAGFVLPSLGFVHIDESAGIDDSDDLYINNNIWWNSPAESPSMVSITNNVGTVIDYVEWSADGTPYGGAYPTGPWTGTIIQAAGQDILYRHSDIDTNSALDWSIGTEAGVPATPHTLNPGQFGSPGEVGISVQGNGFYYDFLDDFSTNTGQWTYIGSASRTGGYMDVCPNGGAVGQGRFGQAINTMFICDFDWRIWDGNGADGLVMMFYKDMAYAPGAGGSLGFDGSNGYGIEFDQYVNAWDLPGEHIGLIQNNVGNHLVSVLDDRVRDSVWHHAQVVVDPTANSIKVYIDNNPVPLISWSGAISTAFSGFGFSAATGGLTDDHRVDNVRIRWLPTGNLITDNLVQDFDTGIGLYNAVSNQIYHNDIIGNTLQAFDNRADPINRWDNGAPGEGNFWSDYSGGGPYVIDANSQDNFPLTSRHTSLSEPEGPGSTPSEEPTPGPETTEESPELLTISVEPEPEELLLDLPISEEKETATETAEEQSIQDQPGETSEVSTEQPAAQELSSTDIITAPQKPKARSPALLPSSIGIISILAITAAVILFRRKHKISK